MLSMTKIFPEFKEWREKRKLTQKQAGKKIGVSQASYCRFEIGEEIPGPITARKIEEVIGIPKETLRPDVFGEVHV